MSSTSLYGNVGNVVLSSKNLTTLYNTLPGNVTTGNVSERNFTTLYTNQSDINPTQPYGNANVEAFLNVGHDSGGNTVQNINMSGTLTVGGESNLGNVGNVHIDGGTYNYVLSTDGTGNLSWVEQGGASANAIPYIHFDVTTTANNQQFTDANLAFYGNVDLVNLFKNGINIEPFYFQFINPTTIQVDIPLQSGDTIDVLASSGTGSSPGGNNFNVQFNGGGLFDGSDNFTYDPISDLLTVGNANIIGTTNLNDVGNVTITGGSSGQYLTTDGSGNLSWSTANTIATGVNANINDVHISGGTNGYILETNGSGNLTWVSPTTFTSNVFLSGITIVSGNLTFSTTGVIDSTIGSMDIIGGVNLYPQLSGIADLVIDRTYNVGIPGSTKIIGDTYFNEAVSPPVANAVGKIVSLGNVSTLKINGGSINQVLTTDGAGNLSWTSTGGIPATIANGTSNVNIPVVDSNITFNVNGTSNIAVISTAGIDITGNANISNSLTVNGVTSLNSVSNVIITGGTSAQVLSTNGSGNLSWTSNIANANYANSANTANTAANATYATSAGSATTATTAGFATTAGSATTATTAGTVTTAAQPNITSTGTLTSLTVAGTTTIQQAKEKVTSNATGSTGTITYDILTQAILLKTANASANFVLNVRGNGTTTFNTFASNNESTTLTYVNKNGATGYVLTSLQIDGVGQTLLWANGTIPTAGTVNGYDVYNFNIIKTGTSTYAVFATVGGYK